MTHQLNKIYAGTQVVALLEVRGPNNALVHRERLLAVRRGELVWDEVDAWRKDLHRDFERALEESTLPEQPDYDAANRFLIKARASMVSTRL